MILPTSLLVFRPLPPPLHALYFLYVVVILKCIQQLEEASQLRCCVEKEFRHRSEEMAQVVQKQQELLERLKEESAAKHGLVLELHTAEGEWDSL